MTDDETKKFALYTKLAWAIYTIMTILLIVILYTMVAQDNQERLFYSLMTAALAYVFRPTDKFMKKRVSRFINPSAAADD